MHITIFFPTGFTAEGIVLSGRGDGILVAIRGWDDVAEFRNDEGRWLAENGDAVIIEPYAAARSGDLIRGGASASLGCSVGTPS
jgi:hypothetical protein